MRDTRSGTVDRVIEVTLPGETLRCTGEHPFWVSGTGWVDASSLRPGMMLASAGGSNILVVQTNVIRMQTRVHTLNVSGAHTYFVGRSKVLVHNKGF